jgi:quercetin dioxygenase-like cupin family protein
MAKMAAINHEDVKPETTYQAPREATGVVWSKALSPPGYALWLTKSELEDGGTLTWSNRHGDDGVYVLSGSLEIGGRSIPAGGAIIVESGAEASARAAGTTKIVHVGTASDTPPTDGLLGAPKPDGHHTHLVDPEGHFVSGQREGVRAVWFADSTCPTCRIALFTVEVDGRKDGAAHHHTADEIIFVLGGSISMGRATYGPGTALSIPGGVRYGFVGDPSGHHFLNFRRDISEQFTDRDGPGVLESALSRGGHLVKEPASA